MIQYSFRSLLYLSGLLFIIAGCKISPSTDSITPVVAQNGMVVTAHPLASQVGIDVLQNGGNAYDAAIAVKFALAVVYPRAGNLGGGGFAVIRNADGLTTSLDFREKAPNQSTEKMYLDENDEVIDKLSSFGHLSVGVPGTVDGMWALHQKYGHLAWKTLLQPAIDLALNGFVLTEKEAGKLNQFQEDLLLANDSNTVFFNKNAWRTNDSIQLPVLAESLKLIRDKGKEGFYKGITADHIVAEMKANGGLITHDDLESYSSVWRDPIIAEFEHHTVISMPPPSSGGIALAQLLMGSTAYNIDEIEHNSAEMVHLLAELERRVYADRASHLGDPDFYDVPEEMLLDKAYIVNRNSSITPDEATSSQEIKEGKVDIVESVETTHFSIVDKDRNAIGITTTLNGNYGSKIYVDEAGFFLNNEMDDFSVKPGHPNQFGLVGAEANAIAPGKRMLSSMTPTIVEKEGELYMVIGTPGGATIITSVFQTILNVVEYKMNIQEAVQAKRFHHQWLPDRILHEKDAFSEETIIELESLGHALQEWPQIGRVDAILIHNDSILHGAADPRGDDKAIGY